MPTSAPIMKAASWLTSRRVRAHGLILAACLWSVYVWNMATPGLLDRAGNLKGTDFLHLYTLGSLALDHCGADLYNMEAQSKLAAQRVPAAAGIRYLPLYPPQVSIFFAPFTRLSYPWALLLWLLSSSLLYVLCCYAIWRACPNLYSYKLITVIIALAFPAFWHLIAWGQTSALALACFTAAFLALKAKRDFLAGLALGSLIFKPQLALAAAILFVITLQWRIIAGAILSSAVQVTTALIYYGGGPIRQWLHSMLKTPSLIPLLEPKPYQTHCLRTFWSMLIPWPALSLSLYLFSAILVAALAVACWRSALTLSLRYSALLLASVLLSPHLTIYDLVILAPAFLLLSNWIAASPNDQATPHLKIILYLTFTLPLIGPLARWTHLQLSVLVMATLLYVLWNLGRDSISVGEMSLAENS
jgi:hypothetical protein